MKRTNTEKKPLPQYLQLFKDQLTLQSANNFINAMNSQLDKTNTISREDGRRLDIAYEFVKEYHTTHGYPKSPFTMSDVKKRSEELMKIKEKTMRKYRDTPLEELKITAEEAQLELSAIQQFDLTDIDSDLKKKYYDMVWALRGIQEIILHPIDKNTKV